MKISSINLTYYMYDLINLITAVGGGLHAWFDATFCVFYILSKYARNTKNDHVLGQ